VKRRTNYELCRESPDPLDGSLVDALKDRGLYYRVRELAPIRALLRFKGAWRHRRASLSRASESTPRRGRAAS